MAYASDLTRTIVLRARRDTVVLVLAVTAATFALASAIHSRPSGTPAASHPGEPQWTGELADLAPSEGQPAQAEPISSASLVVPKSELALPPMPMRSLVKLRGCDGGPCVTKTNGPTPVRRPVGTQAAALHRAQPTRHVRPTLMSRLNPLNHLPDMATLGRPFAVAGDTVSNWFSRF